MFFQRRKFVFAIILGAIFFVPVVRFDSLQVFAQANWSQSADFFVDSTYDLYERNKIEAQLLKTTNKFYFYADKQWYQNFSQKLELDNRLYNLSSNFEYKTYPILTGLLGNEDNPGVDNDSRVIVVLEPLKEKFGGYIRVIDKYSRSAAGNSNEGQIIYLNSDSILKFKPEILDYQLAHEFTHLITLNQKPDAEVWFYELMSEVAAKIAGFDVGAITQQRAQHLLYSTSINLAEWANSDKDYAKVYLLGLYLQEQFGSQLFSEALKYPSQSGLISFEETLKKYQTNFEKVFLNWLAANIVNDCSLGREYCYQSPVLKGYSVVASSYYLPTQSQSSLSVTDSIKGWGAKWQKITGGSEIIKLKFTIPEETPIHKIPYIIESIEGKKTVGFLDFSSVNIGEVYVEGMGTKNKAIYFIPFIGFNADWGKTYYYSWQATNLESTEQQEKEVIQALLKKIEELKRQIALLEARLAMQKTYQSNFNCAVFSRDLYYGINSNDVKCLQQFLANLGPEIYPEGLITGYYGPLTQAAVKRYQTFKGIITTGYFGPLTRAKANQEL
jgi:hypothetical protein